MTLSFNEHLETVLTEANRGIVILRNLQSVLSREALLTFINRLFIPILIIAMRYMLNCTIIHFMLN